MNSGTDNQQNDAAATDGMRDRIRNAMIVIVGSAMMVGLSFAAVTMVASPDGWVMKATRAMMDQQQAVATSFAMNLGD